MGELLGAIIGLSGGLVMVLGVGVYFVLLGWVPLMVLSATRNIKQIRVQLERLNDTLDSKLSADGPTPFTRTGPLSLSGATGRSDIAATERPFRQ